MAQQRVRIGRQTRPAPPTPPLPTRPSPEIARAQRVRLRPGAYPRGDVDVVLGSTPRRLSPDPRVP